MNTAPTPYTLNYPVLYASWINTKLGPMIAISDDQGLYLLEFSDKYGLEREIERLKCKTNTTILPKSSPVLESITLELHAYFAGTLTEFKTPLHLSGSPFQKRVWEELLRLSYGVTRTYAAQAKAMGSAKAYRAVANANGANQFAIAIPCHRIINSNGALGGYSGGSWRKQWLIDHEKKSLENET